jgi:hypothetical protein
MEDGTGTFELPGDALRFSDVTSLFTDAAAGTLLNHEGCS